MAIDDFDRKFLFKDDNEIDRNNLHQGDLLKNTDPLSSAIKEAHGYYATATDYSHFMVLSQSCDLVLRNGVTPKTKYITLAAVRPVEAAIEQEIEKTKFKDVDFPIPLSDVGKRQELTFKLERFVNNTVDDYFFISKYWHSEINENLCVFLQLSIPLHARKHYKACLTCKIGELEDIFAAKIGWATGNMYSRVGTIDLIERYDKEFDKEFKEKFAEEVQFPGIVWYHRSQVNFLKKLIVQWIKDNPSKTLDDLIAKDLLKKVPTLEEMLAERVTDMLVQNKYLRDDIQEIPQKVKFLLGNNTLIKKLLREMRSSS